jgi:FMN reductase
MPRLVALVGAVTPPGRLNAAMQTAVDSAAARPGVAATLLSLADHRLGFADGRPLESLTDDAPRLVRALAEADAVLLATPVYRGTFTGALKNLLDLTPVEALLGKPVGLVAMGASTHHYLGVDWHLRAVLAWFGALTAPTSVYLESAHFKEGKLADAGATAALDALVTTVLALAAQPRDRLGPPPLAAGRG